MVSRPCRSMLRTVFTAKPVTSKMYRRTSTGSIRKAAKAPPTTACRGARLRYRNYNSDNPHLQPLRNFFAVFDLDIIFSSTKDFSCLRLSRCFLFVVKTVVTKIHCLRRLSQPLRSRFF
uniref:Electron transfer flavoprotein-ubiquinone oxidoreductase n=1 Tax=Schistocephalus solidus TaxID=70667 RepID=A0A0X3PBX1_SCHSO